MLVFTVLTNYGKKYFKQWLKIIFWQWNPKNEYCTFANLFPQSSIFTTLIWVLIQVLLSKFCNQFFSRNHVPYALYSYVGDLSILPLLGGLYESRFFLLVANKVVFWFIALYTYNTTSECKFLQMYATDIRLQVSTYCVVTTFL